MIRSRRQLLRAAAAIAAGLATGCRAAAAAKASQAGAQYQSTPKDGQSCAMCQLFRPPQACQVVAGKISSAGWCKYFSLPD
jgi:anaerobic selenocysteine-containing dehydrogenase